MYIIEHNIYDKYIFNIPGNVQFLKLLKTYKRMYVNY